MPDLEQSIGVFGEELILWICMLRQTTSRPPAEHVHRQANFLLDELKGSRAAQEVSVQAVDDGMFVIAALLDELAMSLPDLRPLWSARPLQATRWTTNNAGVEVFQRLERVRQGPKSILVTYMVILGIGFQGRFGLPGADRYGLAQARRDLALQLRIDPDRDWFGGVLRPTRRDGTSTVVKGEPWHRSLWIGRALAVLTLLGGLSALAAVLYTNLVR